MSFLKPSVAETRRTRLIVGALSVLATLIIAAGFYSQAITKVPKPPPRIIYVDSWGGDRSRDDALAARATEAAALAARLAAAKAYIASLPPEKRKLAQAEYDRYVAAKPRERVN